jgi:hypothetical protein
VLLWRIDIGIWNTCEDNLFRRQAAVARKLCRSGNCGECGRKQRTIAVSSNATEKRAIGRYFCFARAVCCGCLETPVSCTDPSGLRLAAWRRQQTIAGNIEGMRGQIGIKLSSNPAHGGEVISVLPSGSAISRRISFVISAQQWRGGETHRRIYFAAMTISRRTIPISQPIPAEHRGSRLSDPETPDPRARRCCAASHEADDQHRTSRY